MTERLSIETQTLHAELMERLSVRDAQRSIANLEGTFTTKTISGGEYLYFLHYDADGRRRNICLGRKTTGLDELVARYREGRKEEILDPLGIRELCAQLKAGRAAIADTGTARVIRELAEGGVFHVGGVLVGTQSFACIGNLLGVVWDATTLKTRDVDIAIERNVSIAVPDMISDVPKTLESMEMGFFPIPRLNHKEPSTSFSIRRNPLRVDLITPQKSRSDGPVFIKRLNAAAQPLKFLDYLIEDPIRGAVLNGDATIVLIPQPIRYALHKLIVSQERDVTAGAKRQKDLWQAFQLLEFFVAENPLEIEPSWNALVSRGPGWKKGLEAGLADMQSRFGTLDFTGNGINNRGTP
jgi:hypothetical protein